MNIIINDEDSDFNDFINATEHDYTTPELLDCLFFYTTENVCRHINKRVKCENCLKAFLATSDVAKEALRISQGQMPHSFESFINPHKELIHPNYKMYQLILQLELLFRKYSRFRNAFDLILNEFSASDIEIKFECKDHTSDALDVLAFIVKFYVQLRMKKFLKKKWQI